MSSIKLIYIAICYSLCYSICYNLSTVSAASHTNEDIAKKPVADEEKMTAASVVGMGMHILTPWRSQDLRRAKMSKPTDKVEPIDPSNNPIESKIVEDLEDFLKSDTYNHYGYENTKVPKLETTSDAIKVIRMEGIVDMKTYKKHNIEIVVGKSHAHKLVYSLRHIQKRICTAFYYMIEHQTYREICEALLYVMRRIVKFYQPKIIQARIDRDPQKNDKGYVIEIRMLLSLIIGNYIHHAPGIQTDEERESLAKEVEKRKNDFKAWMDYESY